MSRDILVRNKNNGSVLLYRGRIEKKDHRTIRLIEGFPYFTTHDFDRKRYEIMVLPDPGSGF